MLSAKQIRVILARLKWDPVYEDNSIVVAKKRGGGYSENREILGIEARLSVMLEAASRAEEH